MPTVRPEKIIGRAPPAFKGKLGSAAPIPKSHADLADPELLTKTPEEVAEHFAAQKPEPPPKPNRTAKQVADKQLRGTMNRLHQMNAPQPVKLYLDPKRTAKRGGFNIRAVVDVLLEQGLDPTEELVKILKAGTLPPEIQVRTLASLMEYVHSKKKSVEITGEGGGPVQLEHVSDAALMRIAAQALPDADIVDV